MLKVGPAAAIPPKTKKGPDDKANNGRDSSLANGRHATLAQFSAGRSTQRREAAKSVAPQISQHSPSRLFLLKDGDMNQAFDLSSRKSYGGQKHG